MRRQHKATARLPVAARLAYAGGMQNIYGGKQLAASFHTVRKNTIQVAEDIPEDKYSYVPAEGARSVAQTLAHIAVSTRMWHEAHASGITKMGITELTVAVWPWLLTMLVFLVLVTYVPSISLWLPRTLGMLS